MKSLRTYLGVCLVASFSFGASAKDITVKNQIESYFNQFQGKVNKEKVTTLLGGLSSLSSTEANMCFVSLDDYNDCMDYAKTVYAKMYLYMDDLFGKDVTVEVTKSLRPYEDEEYYTLAFKISYENKNPDYPTKVNFDTIDLGIENDAIKDIIYSREWFGLSDYVKY